MKIVLILASCFIFLISVRVAEADPQASTEISLIDLKGNETGEILAKDLVRSLKAVNTWWKEHGNGFKNYPWRVAGDHWKFTKTTDKVRELEELEGKEKFRWYASYGEATKFRWQLFFYCDASYTFMWMVDPSGKNATVVEVIIASPKPDWSESP